MSLPKKRPLKAASKAEKAAFSARFKAALRLEMKGGHYVIPPGRPDKATEITFSSILGSFVRNVIIFIIQKELVIVGTQILR